MIKIIKKVNIVKWMKNKYLPLNYQINFSINNIILNHSYRGILKVWKIKINNEIENFLNINQMN